MKRSQWIPLVALCLSSCNPIYGTLNVTKPFMVMLDGNPCNADRDPSCNPDRKDQLIIEKGDHSAQFEMSSSQSGTLTVEQNDQKYAVNISVPSDKALPEYSGDFELKSDEIGQSFDLAGNVRTEESDSSSSSAVESCSRTTSERVCESERRNGRNEEHCHDITRTISGQQDVRYHMHDTTKNLQVTIQSAETGTPVATFSGSRTDSSKIYEYQGICQ